MSSRMCLQWKGLEYSVPVKGKNRFDFRFWKNKRNQEYKTILKEANGCMNTGDFIAVLGPSGSGKTTLLAAISQRIRDDVKGEIILNGVQIDPEDMSAISSFMPQFDIIVEALTAFEHLYFMSHFKMDKTTTKAEKIQKVNGLLLAVGLKNSANTRVSLLSGGERKRLSFAEELITDPPFIFCDEPTTGLDSYSALSVISTLRQLTRPKRLPMSGSDIPALEEYDSSSKSGINMEMQIISQEEFDAETSSKTYLNPLSAAGGGDEGGCSEPRVTSFRKGIMCSIHQPTSEVFELFTHIILMDAGEIVYYGSLDDACLFFSRLGFYCPQNCNPADFYIKIISGSEHVHRYKEIVRNNFEQEISSSCLIRAITEPHDFSLDSARARKISWFSQMYLLIWRTAIEKKRTFKEQIATTALFLLSSILLAIMFSNVNGTSQASIQDIEGCFFMISTEIIFTSSYSTIYIFPYSLPIMRRTTGEGLYHLSSYYLARVLCMIPEAFLISYVFVGIIYVFVSFHKGFLNYLVMGLPVSLAAVSGTAYGIFLSSIFETEFVAREMAAPFDLLFLLFGGLYLNLNTTFKYLKYFSMFYFTNEALAYTYWIDVDYIECSTTAERPCLRNGTEVLMHYAYNTHPLTSILDYMGLGILTLIFHVLAFYRIRRYVRRRGFY